MGQSGNGENITKNIAIYNEKTNIDEKYKYKSFHPQHLGKDVYFDNQQKLPHHKVVFDDLCAYQNEIYYKMDIDYLRNEVFCFSDKVKALPIYKKWYEKRGTYNAAHIRRTDAISTTWYTQVSKNSYIKAMLKNNVDPETAIWVSDEPNERKNCDPEKPKISDTFHVDQFGFPNLEDFLILVFAKKVFRANSSFSFFAAMINDVEDHEIFSPVIYGNPK